MDWFFNLFKSDKDKGQQHPSQPSGGDSGAQNEPEKKDSKSGIVSWIIDFLKDDKDPKDPKDESKKGWGEQILDFFKPLLKALVLELFKEFFPKEYALFEKAEKIEKAAEKTAEDIKSTVRGGVDIIKHPNGPELPKAPPPPKPPLMDEHGIPVEDAKGNIIDQGTPAAREWEKQHPQPQPVAAKTAPSAPHGYHDLKTGSVVVEPPTTQPKTTNPPAATKKSVSASGPNLATSPQH